MGERTIAGDSTVISVTINGKPKTIGEGLSLSDLLRELNQEERLVVIELNGTILRRPLFAGTKVGEGDVIEIAHFVGGGAK